MQQVSILYNGNLCYLVSLAPVHSPIHVYAWQVEHEGVGT
jgi:hypothetical protein